MKIAQINMVSYGSTGKIMLQIAETAREMGHTAKTYATVPYDRYENFEKLSAPGHSYWGSRAENRTHYYLGRLLGRNGCFSYSGTRKLIADLKAFAPDVVHLHNLHKFCIHLPSLFAYLKQSKVKVIWTLHDCWPFTGQCAHFVMANCDKWKSGCHNCPQLSVYPRSDIDNTKWMYEKKKAWFTGLQDMTIVVCSAWLEKLVKQSFLKQYPVVRIPNGIDLSVFQPTPGDFRKKYHLEDKTILLGVSFGWGKRKGLDVFSRLAERLPDNYRIVLVGVTEEDRKQIPERILAIGKTDNVQDLAEIYTAADLFVNPTREDTFPTVNMEALACGTPVLTFQTGGSPEIGDATCSSVVPCEDVEALEQEILRICTEKPYSQEACLRRAKEFDRKKTFENYVKLYETSAK